MNKKSAHTKRAPKQKKSSRKLATLRRYPKAFPYHWAGCWVIYVPHHSGNVTIGRGKTAAQAWNEAAKHRGSLWASPRTNLRKAPSVGRGGDKV